MPSVPFASGPTPRVRTVATRSSSGRRTFSPTDPSNVFERNSARSTGTIAVSLSR